MSYIKMQNAGSHLSEKRISPDITCIPFTFTGTTSSNKSSHVTNGNGSVSPRGIIEGTSTSSSSSDSSLNNVGGSPITANNLSVLQNMTAIAEVPVGLYEFVLGEAGEVRILCKVCQYISNKKSNFKRHFTNMHFVHNEESKQLECCGIRFSTKGDKFQHTKSVHKFGYKCFICSKVFDRPALLQRHLAKHTGKKPYKCSLCSYQTPNKANAKRHIEKKHSDVQEGSILFVTEDGEQIHMEVVSKSGKGTGDMTNSSQNISSMTPSASNCGGGATTACFMSMTSPPIPILPAPYFNMLQSRPSATVTSSSASSPENAVGRDPFLSSIFGMNIFNNEFSSIDGKKKQRQITHSIEKIIKEQGDDTMGRGNQASSAPATATKEDKHQVPTYLPNLNHHPPAFNQKHDHALHWYCPPDWSRSSTLSLFPFNTSREYSIGAGHQSTAHHPHGIVSAFRPPVPPPPPPTSNQGSFTSSSLPSFVFYQCPHGCWHSTLDNQRSAASDFCQSSPDLRFYGSISQQTGSFFGKDREDGGSSEIIDVVGDDDDDDEEEDEDTNHHNCKKEDDEEDTICEGLGSCTTSTNEDNLTIGRNNNNNEKMGEAEIKTRPPVGHHHHHHPMSLPKPSTNNNSARDDRDGEDALNEQNGETEELTYIPKKLRISRAYSK